MDATSDPANVPSVVGRWDVRDAVTVRLVRHGQTQSYETDSGLTELGHTQAYAKGAALAADLEFGTHVWLPHAPTIRATETALAVYNGIAEATPGTNREGVRLGKPYTDPWFDNFRLWCADQTLDPTQAFANYRARRADTPIDELPGWFAEMERFVSLMVCGKDPITYWLSQPMQYFEPPASTVRRFWTGIKGAIVDAPIGLQLVVSTHSGCIRAIAATALGYDPGEPHNTEDVMIRLASKPERALLAFRGHAVELAIPTSTTPPWWPTTDTTSRQG